MNQYSSVEEYAAHVSKETSRLLASLCRQLGAEHPTTLAVLNLCTEADNIVQSKQMQQEKADGYDLAALKVKVETASNSETGWEREE